MATKQSTLDFFIRNGNEAIEPVAAKMANDSLNSQDQQAGAHVNISNGQELCSEQSDRSNEANNTEISSSTLSSTVTGDSDSETEHELTSQSDSDDRKTAAKDIEVVPKSGGRKRIRCKACNENSDIVKRFCYRGRIPPICTPTGTEARKGTIAKHLSSEAHKESVKLNRIKGLSSSEKIQAVPLLKIANAQTHLLANRIGKLIIQVYNDAKNLAISAFTWPSRVVASEIAHTFDYNSPFKEYDASVFDLQYVTPTSHQELLKIIVQTDLPRFKQEIDDCLTASFRCDASMDRTQKDNEFMLLNVINKNGNELLRYVGLGHVKNRGAKGHLEALKEGATDTIGLNKVLTIANHMTTDGENKNVGEHNGLWKLIDDERAKEEAEFPMLKSVCAVHSSALAYHDLCKEVSDVDTLIRKVSAISSFFHASAARTAELEKYAKEQGLNVRRFPKYYEVRWTEFTAGLIDAVLTSWRALMVFCERSEEEQAKGFGRLLSNKDNLMLMCLLGDVLFLLKVFQKKLQGDDITIVDIVPETKKLIAKLDKLHQRPIIGGWEDKFSQSYNEEDGKFFGTLLWQKERRTTRRNLYVSETRAFSAIKVEVLQALHNFMERRLDIDDHAKENFSSFVKFTANEEDIREVHASVAPDLDL